MSPLRLVVIAVVMAAAFSSAVSADDDFDPTTQCTAWPQITALSFVPNQSTQTRRRTSNIPTLNCIGNCPSDARLDGAQCMQIGLSDLGTPSWKCIPNFASATRRYGFGTIRVECEGCLKKGDSTVVKGSCALFYSVVDMTARSKGSRGYNRHYSEASNVDIFGVVALLLFICVAVHLARKVFCNPAPRNVYTEQGYPVQGVPVGGAVHHHYGGGGGYGGGGFGTGMLTGLVVGDMLSRPHYAGGYGGGYDGGYDDSSSWGGGGGWGSSDGAGYGGGDSI